MMRALALLLVLSLPLLAHAEPFSTWPMDAPASAPHPVTPLEWSDPEQVLLYRSCGCADGCWEARLYDRAQVTKKRAGGDPTLALKCDCETLLVRNSRTSKLREYEASCKRFEGDDKLERIVDEMKKLSADL